MNNKSAITKLTERDRKILSSNSKICTDLHGEGCYSQKPEEDDKLLN